MTHASRLRRTEHMVERSLLVGGLPGCGKSMMTKILDTLEGVELQKYNYALEDVCSLHFLEKLDDQTAAVMIRLLADETLYNLMMSREANFRPSDLSSVFKNPHPWRYFKRLFTAGDAQAMERIQRERPILHLVIHYLLPYSVPLTLALEERCVLVEVLRHPLYMIKQWHAYYNERHKTRVRDLTVCLDHEGEALPFFVWGWEDLFARANVMDRIIYSIDRLIRSGESSLERLGSRKSQVLLIPFERFVLSPEPYIDRIADALGSRVTAATARVMKSENVPRKMWSEGIARPIYKEYGWEPPTTGNDERAELTKRREFAAASATPEAMAVLDRLCAEYEERHMKGLLTPL